MKHFNHLRRVLIIGWVLSFSAAQLCAQELETPPHAKTPPPTTTDQTWLWSALKGQKSFDGLAEVQQNDVEQFETLLIATLNETRKPKDEIAIKDLQDRWAPHQWLLQQSPSGKWFVLREHPDHQNGRGVYAFRTGVESRIVLQAPHRYNDLMTGSIITKLFQQQSVSAIALNTIHRNKVDLSHTPLHFINAFTSAVIKVQPDVTIFQIHGFTNNGKTGAAKFAKIIVSDSTKFPGRSARQTAIELKTTFGADHSRLFPVDIQQLGGTTNRQAEVAHGLGSPNFLHLELNRDFRAKLDTDASVRASFFASLVGGAKR